jgi:hypothetical protein
MEKGNKKLIMDNPEQPLDSLNREQVPKVAESFLIY